MQLIKRILVTTVFVIAILTFGLFLFLKFYKPPLSENYGKVDTQLFVGDSDNQPLIVAFGGSNGGNTWTDEFWMEIRNKFLAKGYAVLSIGYFRAENTPTTLDRISINAIYDSIKKASNHSKIDKGRIALLGSSRGGELVLNIASRYNDVDAVIAIVPPHVSFPALTSSANTSSWTFNDKEVPFVPFSYEAISSVIKGNSYRTCEIMLKNREAVVNSTIEVEKINGSILLMSATNDEVWPSIYMSEKIVDRLKMNQFKHYYEHSSFEGRHTESSKHFDVVFKFLDEHFKVN
jgi:uncharacterized protein